MKKKKLLKRIEDRIEILNVIKEGIENSKCTINMNKDCKETNTFIPTTHPIYHPDPILFPKYCKECKYPILRLDKLVTVLMNGQRIFSYDKKTN